MLDIGIAEKRRWRDPRSLSAARHCRVVDRLHMDAAVLESDDIKGFGAARWFELTLSWVRAKSGVRPRISTSPKLLLSLPSSLPSGGCPSREFHGPSVGRFGRPRPAGTLAQAIGFRETPRDRRSGC